LTSGDLPNLFVLTRGSIDSSQNERSPSLSLIGSEKFIKNWNQKCRFAFAVSLCRFCNLHCDAVRGGCTSRQSSRSKGRNRIDAGEGISGTSERRHCAGKRVKPLTPSQHPDRLLGRRRQKQKLIAKATLAASLICGAIAETGTNSPAQTSQPGCKQPPTPITGTSRIERRRIGPVFLAA
jgi:hypothetical protein